MGSKTYRYILVFSLLFTSLAEAQDSKRQILRGIVENETTETIMKSVHVLNLNTIVGSITDDAGVFEIEAQVNDTLYFSYLGFKPFKVAVTQDMIKFENPKFKLTVLAFALEEVVISPYKLTGYLDVDVKNVPLNLPVDITFKVYPAVDTKLVTEIDLRYPKPLERFSILQTFYTICLGKIRPRCVSSRKCVPMMKSKTYSPQSSIAKY